MSFFSENWGTVAGAAGGFIVGGPYGAAMGAQMGGQMDSNRLNRKMSQKQMDFQESMSNSAYQRAMWDMRKAGLNPMMASKQGGASTPNGASIESKSVSEGAMSSAIEKGRLEQQFAMNESSIGLMAKQGEAASANAISARANAAKASSEAALNAERLKKEKVSGQVYEDIYGLIPGKDSPLRTPIVESMSNGAKYIDRQLSRPMVPFKGQVNFGGR